MGSKVNKSHYGYFFIAPFFIGFAVFGLAPILYTLYLSFMKWDGFTDPVYVGVANYTRLLHDSFFYQTIWNTLIIWVFSNTPQLILALLLALILNEKFIRGKHFFRAVYFFPHIITPVTLGVIFSLMFDWQTGSINKLLMNLGIVHDPVNWFNSPWWSRIIASAVICWQYFGFNMIVFIAGLQSIPNEVYEAAEMDGATKRQTAVHITLPLLRPVFLFVFITSVIGGLQLFDAPLMLGDGPGNTSRTMVMYLYETAFKNFDYSYGAAVAYGIFIVVMFFTAITARASRLKE
ncbi:carbohydrate ABC transporter permease [Paenibacillus sacheonensis]|uniref:ABC transporter permease subunit n=1 Tax=Paenibacillus sacheonensis TaxID=742054 RepID=A0A7X5BYX0_9BACL|nr:sugar ABC transporter permease [Paenibacillus sacheonensis]MBM7564048.1 ABC-type sugar transport system permease subunit [Paenibacillus sacheonensis]NBC67620.1 ABC transporter permease subunit [Paenibacillus sacheonensis]